MLIDTHCHLYEEYYENIKGVVDEALAENVKILVNIGCDDKSNKEVIKTTKNYNNIYAAVGIHPEHSASHKKNDILNIENYLTNKKVVAIGEIGLDYYYNKNNSQQQKALFIKMLEIAQQYNVPVIIHSREATLDTITILKKYKLKGIIHSFSGSMEIAQEYIKLGYLLGINGVVTFKKCNLKDTLKQIPIEKIVLETDAPYLSPEPDRGKKNKPANIAVICRFLALIYDVSEQKIAEQTTRNALELFDIKL